MGTEEVTMSLIVYAVGFILATYLMYVISFKNKDITVGDLVGMLFCGGFSWMSVFLCIIAYVCENEDKVIIKKKDPKKKEEFEENVSLLEEHKEKGNL